MAVPLTNQVTDDVPLWIIHMVLYAAIYIWMILIATSSVTWLVDGTTIYGKFIHIIAMFILSDFRLHSWPIRTCVAFHFDLLCRFLFSLFILDSTCIWCWKMGAAHNQGEFYSNIFGSPAMRTQFLRPGHCTRMRDKNGQLALTEKSHRNLSVRLDQKQKFTKKWTWVKHFL